MNYITLLPNNTTLTSQDAVFSAGQNVKFALQQDGNLCLYVLNTNKAWELKWETNTFPSQLPAKCVLQQDGNLVLYDNTGTPYWASGTQNNLVGTYTTLVVDDGGNATLYQPPPNFGAVLAGGIFPPLGLGGMEQQKEAEVLLTR